MGDEPFGVATGAGAVWVTNRLDGTVSRIPSGTREADGDPITVGANPKGIAVGDDAVWVANTDDGTVSRIDPEAVEADAETITVGTEPRGVVAAFGSVWVTNGTDNSVSRIDPEDREVIETIPVGEGPEGITAGAGQHLGRKRRRRHGHPDQPPERRRPGGRAVPQRSPRFGVVVVVAVTRRLICAALAGTALWASCAVSASAAPGRVPGIDISRFQGQIIWSSVADDGVRFAFVQASRGSGEDCSVVPRECGADGFYDFNYLEAKAEGIRVGPYHRAFVGGLKAGQVKTDARAEALVFTNAVGELEDGDLRPALDLETPFADLSSAELRIWARTWLKAVRRDARGEADHLHQREQLERARQPAQLRPRRLQALGRELERARAPGPGRQLGRLQLAGVAVLELGPGPRDHRPGRPQLAPRRLARADRGPAGADAQLRDSGGCPTSIPRCASCSRAPTSSASRP